MSTAGPSDNLQRFRDAGFDIRTPLPAEYADVVKGLSDEEVNVLVGLKKKLDQAQSKTPPGTEYYKYFVHPPF